MASFNKVILAGHLTRDPELRVLNTGTAVVKFSIAINETYTDKNGQRQEKVLFVDVEAFGKKGEAINKFFKKGRPILIEGNLRQDSWEDKNTGEKRTKLGVVAESFSFCDSRKDGEGEQ